MFKIPEWEGDVPKSNVNFVKNHKPNKRKKNKEKKHTIAVDNTKPKILNGNSEKLPNGTQKTNIVINGNDKIKTTTQIKTGKIVEKKNNNKKEKQLIKRKLPNSHFVNAKKKKVSKLEPEDQNYDTDKPDEMLLNAGKRKLNEQIQSDDSEELLFSSNKGNNNPNRNHKMVSNSIPSSVVEMPSNGMASPQDQPKLDKKKNLIKTLLQKENHRRHIDISSNGNKLRERMLERLKAAQFRYLNEKLYTTSGTEAQKLFQSDPVAFQTYHEGYQQQVKKWPVKPLDVIVKKIMKMPKSHLVADMGCGEADLAKRVQQKVRSFDLVAASADVEACDMAHTPLLSASVDAAVYCLALMGTDLTQYLVEANRILKVGGFLLIAEVESRFDDVESFAKEVQRLGFKLKELDKSNQVFFFMEFIKTQDPPVKKSKLPELKLKPCLYKKR